MTRPRPPARIMASDWVRGRLPDVRGRDRLAGWVRGEARYVGPVSGRLTNGTVYSFADSTDGSVRSITALRYGRPALAPVLDMFLVAGDCFYDIGANLGIYTLWASRLVGDTGQVHAFEPVPDTLAMLRSQLALNRASNVVSVDMAVGAEAGRVPVTTVAGASGLAHVVEVAADDAVLVASTTLDAYTAGTRPPSLVKIDVEGHEAAVLAGADRTLARIGPAVVLEVLPANLSRATASYEDVRRMLLRHGYVIFDLRPTGLRVSDPSSPTSNVLALKPADPRHRVLAARLARQRFPRNQTT